MGKDEKEMSGIGNWDLFRNKKDGKAYWNDILKREIGSGKIWNIPLKKYGWGVGIFSSPYGKYSDKHVKVLIKKWFSTKKKAEEYMKNYMKKHP